MKLRDMIPPGHRWDKTEGFHEKFDGGPEASIVRRRHQKLPRRFQHPTEFLENLGHTLEVDVFDNLQAENLIEDLVCEGELFDGGFGVTAAATSSGEGEAALMVIAADGQPTMGGQFTDEIPSAAPRVEDEVVSANPNELEQVKFVPVPAMADGTTRLIGVILAFHFRIIGVSWHGAIILGLMA